MSTIKLQRLRDDGQATLGSFGGLWWTVERPWLDNQRRISCIPVGVYQVRRHVSPSKGECFEVLDVPERTHILIHIANWSYELMGCIAPGMGILSGERMVTSSRLALEDMLAILPEEWELEITNAWS